VTCEVVGSALCNNELLAALSALVQREPGFPQRSTWRSSTSGDCFSIWVITPSGVTKRVRPFAYCTDALGLSKSSAGRRIAAARVCRRFPEVFARVARGELHLSVLCELGKYLNSENATALFEACCGKSYELALELLAARFPKPDVRDSIRRLPARSADVTPDIECAPGAATVAERVVGRSLWRAVHGRHGIS